VWLTAVDVTIVVLAMVAACVALFGGHRARFGWLLISIRRADRLLLAAAALALVRHAVVRQPALHSRVYGAWSAAVGDAGFRAALAPFLATRTAVLAAGYLAVVIIGFPTGANPFRVSYNQFVNLPARWDAEWYLRIARDGYSWNGDAAIPQTVVFFPGMPLLMHVGAVLTGTLINGGLLIALVSFLGALIYLYRLCRPLVGHDRAVSTMWLLAAYPFAVYFGAPYTESVFLLACLGAFFHLSRGEPAASAAWGLLAGASRPNGFFLAAPLALIVLQRVRETRTLRVRDMLPLCAPLVGVLAFSAYLFWQFDAPTAWLSGQAAWGRRYSGLAETAHTLLVDRLDLIARVGFYRYTAGQPFDFLHSLAALVALLSVWPIWRLFGLPYAVFVAINVLPPLISGGTMSVGRMTSVLFPMFMVVGAVVPPRHVPALVAVSSVLQGIIAAAFFTWRAAY
jgi:hypothetical protein